MKIILAPDKFKGTMSSPAVCAILRQAFLQVMPNAELVSLPMADGGEGTVDAILSATNGTLRQVSVSGPFSEPVQAVFGLYREGRSAVIEMAAASGMALVPRSRLNPMEATSFGTGELIRAALDLGVEEITIGIGGSATVDGGAGMAQALGYRLLDAEGGSIGRGAQALERLVSIDVSGVDPRLFQTRIHVACDVTNPLLGPNGAVAVYAPQKGASADMLPVLESNLARLGDLWIRQSMLDSVELPGDGAAGGMGAGLRAFCHARPRSGAAMMMEALQFQDHLRNADLVVTGEGCTDSQTSSGKLCAEIAKTARKEQVPVLLLSGGLQGNLAAFNELFDMAFSTSTGRPSLDEMLAFAKEDLLFTAVNVARLIERTSHQ